MSEAGILRSQYVRTVEKFKNELADCASWNPDQPKLKHMSDRLNNYLGNISSCPKCKSKNVARTHEWVSDVSGVAYAFEMKCLECGEEWSW